MGARRGEMESEVGERERREQGVRERKSCERKKKRERGEIAELTGHR